MSNNNQGQVTAALLMAEVANYSGLPSNSVDADWNWTVPFPNDSSAIMPASSTGFQVSIIVVLSSLIAAGTVLNLATVVSHLQTRLTALRLSGINMLAMNLACCDLLRSTVSAPLLLLSVITRQWPSGLLGCRWYLAMSVFFGTASLNTVTAIAIDRQVGYIFYYPGFIYLFLSAI